MIDYVKFSTENHQNCTLEEIEFRNKTLQYIRLNTHDFCSDLKLFDLRYLFDAHDGPYINIQNILRMSHYRAAPGWIITGVLKYQSLYNHLLLFIDEEYPGV